MVPSDQSWSQVKVWAYSIRHCKGLDRVQKGGAEDPWKTHLSPEKVRGILDSVSLLLPMRIN